MTNGQQPRDLGNSYPVDDYLTDGDQDKLRQDLSVTAYLDAIKSVNQFPTSELTRLPDSLRQSVMRFPDIGIHNQASALDELTAAGYDSEQVLRAAAVQRKLDDPDFAGRRLDERFMEPEVRTLNRGLIVELIAERPKDGVSRHQAAFFERILPNVADGTVIGVAAAEDELAALTPFVDNLEGKEGVDPERAYKGLLLKAMQVEDSHLLLDPLATEMKILTSLPSEFEYQYIRGTVQSPPGESTNGMLTFTDGQQVEGCNVRIAMPVGADTDILLERSEKEVYYGRRVRVWYEGTHSWVKGRITNPDDYDGHITVEADEVVTGNMQYMGGRGLTIHGNSPDIDFRDPDTTEEAMHPLEVYKHVRTNAVVRVHDADPEFGGSTLGVIKGIDSAKQQYMVEIPGGEHLIFGFDDANVEWVDNGTAARELYDKTIAARGARFMLPPGYLDNGKAPVYGILGVDLENQTALVKRYSSRRYPQRQIDEIPLGALMDIQSPEQIAAFVEERFPLLGTESARSLKARFVHDGQVLEGQLLGSDTVPFYFEIVIEKTRDEILAERYAHGPAFVHSIDHYHRYDVTPDNILEIVKRQKQ